MDSEKTVTKRPRGRPRLTDEQRSIKHRESQEQNIIRLRLLRQNKPEITCRYYKKYYEAHKNEKPEKVDAILFVVDVATKHLAIEFMRGTKAQDTYYALVRIYESDDFFSHPTRMITDGGKEFEGEFETYIESQNIDHVVKLKGQTVGMVDTAMREIRK